MDFFNVISLSKAQRKVEERLGYLSESSIKPVEESLGMVIAADVLSPENLPAFHKSAVDGYAVKARDTYAATESVPSVLKITGKVIMGEAPDVDLFDGEAIYVPTGGMLPKGADSMVAIEDTQSYGKEIAVFKRLHLRENTLFVGEDIGKDSVIVKKGSVVTPMTIGLLAGAGVVEIEVFRAASFYIISTGDELLDIRDAACPGKIRDMNTYILSALTTASGHRVSGTVKVKDNAQTLKDAVQEGLESADIVLISGGSSVGESDFTYSVISSLEGDVFIKGIALKPGKPTICGSAKGKLVFGLPGHPMAAAVVFKILVSGVIKSLRGQCETPNCYAEAECNFPSSPGRVACQPVKCIFDGVSVKARPLFGKSGILSPLSEADGFIVIPENSEGINRGQLVPVYGFMD